MTVRTTTVSSGAASYGAGFYVYYHARMDVQTSAFNNNDGTYGGGIRNYNANLTVSSSTFSDNFVVGT